jgi:hypothetical protein
MVAGLLALGLQAAPAHAQQSRSFVSGLGSDLNAPNCTRTAPCRTFQVAHDNTLASGEIAVLDAGSYGAVTITKNISIINDGVGEAGALVSGGGTGITINAGPADSVTLRGLTIKGLVGFGGSNGIVFTRGFSLTIENCVIRNMTGAFPLGNGVAFAPTTFSRLTVSNTVVTDNANFGVAVAPIGAVSASAMLDNVGMYNNATGFGANSAAITGANLVGVAISRSVSAGNGQPGYFAFSAAAGQPADITLVNSVSAANATGIRADGPGTVIGVGESTVTLNGATWVTNAGGNIRSFLDNQVFNNFDGDPAFPGAAILHK